MYKAKLEDIKKLREETEASVADCREALTDSEGDFEKAKKILQTKALARAEKKAEREVKAGYVFSYIHHNGKVGALVSLACETDFVAKTDDFQHLGKELALHLAAARPTTIEELLDQEYVRDPSKKIIEVIKTVIGKLGENIQVVEFKVLSI